jgi:heme/copper-type cytochrome/quinol oxidase subunit 2
MCCWRNDRQGCVGSTCFEQTVCGLAAGLWPGRQAGLWPQAAAAAATGMAWHCAVTSTVLIAITHFVTWLLEQALIMHKLSRAGSQAQALPNWSDNARTRHVPLLHTMIELSCQLTLSQWSVRAQLHSKRSGGHNL